MGNLKEVKELREEHCLWFLDVCMFTYLLARKHVIVIFYSKDLFTCHCYRCETHVSQFILST